MLLASSGSRRVREVSKVVSISVLLAVLCSFTAAIFGEDRKAAQEALAAARKLRTDLHSQAAPTREQMLACAKAFRQVYLSDPRYGGCDDAVFEEASIYQEAGKKFGNVADYKNAARLYRFLLKGYPSSKFCPDALLSLGDALSGPLEDNTAAQEVYQQLQTQYGKSAAAASLAARAQSEPPKKTATPPTKSVVAARNAAPLSMVQNIRHWSTSDYTRVIIDMDVETKYAKTRIDNPDRIFFDISNSKLSRDLLNKTFVVGDEFIKQVRVGQNQPDVVRVVLDFAAIADYSVFELHDPFRLVVDVYGNKSGKESARSGTMPRQEVAAAKPQEEPTPEKKPPQPEPAPKLVSPPEGADPIPSHPAGSIKVTDIPGAPIPLPKVSEPTPVEIKEAAKSTTFPAAAGKPAPSPPTSASPKSASATSRGDRTMTRMLGLKIGRIVLDPGHGGHDTGTIGKGGLREKELVLEVAKQLKSMLEDKIHAEVLLTRDDDRFISLEERTAIANQARADLFVSIHANSSVSRITSGVETYFLDFAKSEAEREVAARENASTVRNIHDLENLIKKIAQADKSAESRELASMVQKKLYGGARQLFPTARNRGVRSAPFVVLIGANMPSVLAEVAFISNPKDEKILRQEDNRQRLAQALYAGIEGYMKTLGADVAQVQRGAN
jgi:N-acetylmuramoyl-L-alanine amidase